MHELGIVLEIVKVIDEVKEENNLTSIAAITLQIGEFSDVIPDYLTECFKVVKAETYLENTKMKIEIIPAKARCSNCSSLFLIKENGKICPFCHSKDFKIISGHEFEIKEIEAI